MKTQASGNKKRGRFKMVLCIIALVLAALILTGTVLHATYYKGKKERIQPYASLYPAEVEAIVSLDGTSTAYIGEDMPGFVESLLGVAKVQQAIGLTSVLASLTTNRTELLSRGYTEQEIHDLLAFAGFSINNNVLDQMKKTTESVKTANKTAYPSGVPYFKIISKQTYETKNAQIKLSPEVYQQEHLQRVGAQDHYAILVGTHFIYLNNVEAIRSITDAFLSVLK